MSRKLGKHIKDVSSLVQLSLIQVAKDCHKYKREDIMCLPSPLLYEMLPHMTPNQLIVLEEDLHSHGVDTSPVWRQHLKTRWPLRQGFQLLFNQLEIHENPARVYYFKHYHEWLSSKLFDTESTSSVCRDLELSLDQLKNKTTGGATMPVEDRSLGHLVQELSLLSFPMKLFLKHPETLDLLPACITRLCVPVGLETLLALTWMYSMTSVDLHHVCIYQTHSRAFLWSSIILFLLWILGNQCAQCHDTFSRHLLQIQHRDDILHHKKEVLNCCSDLDEQIHPECDTMNLSDYCSDADSDGECDLYDEALLPTYNGRSDEDNLPELITSDTRTSCTCMSQLKQGQPAHWQLTTLDLHADIDWIMALVHLLPHQMSLRSLLISVCGEPGEDSQLLDYQTFCAELLAKVSIGQLTSLELMDLTFPSDFDSDQFVSQIFQAATRLEKLKLTCYTLTGRETEEEAQINTSETDTGQLGTVDNFVYHHHVLWGDNQDRSNTQLKAILDKGRVTETLALDKFTASAVFNHIQGCSELRELDVEGAGVSADSLCELISKLPLLRKINISGVNCFKGQSGGTLIKKFSAVVAEHRKLSKLIMRGMELGDQACHLLCDLVSLSALNKLPYQQIDLSMNRISWRKLMEVAEHWRALFVSRPRFILVRWLTLNGNCRTFSQQCQIVEAFQDLVEELDNNIHGAGALDHVSQM